MNLDCIPCFLRQGLQAARFASKDEKIQENVLRKIMYSLLEEKWTSTPPILARIVHQTVKSYTGTQDPYKEVKRESNKRILSQYSHYTSMIQRSTNPFLTALKLAIAGNIIDYGALSDFDLDKSVQKILTTHPAIDKSSELQHRIERANHLFYLADNAGEIVFDRMFLETINQLRTDPLKVTFVVKGGPIINDATEEDFHAVALTQIPDIEMVKVGIGIPDTGPERNDPKFLDLMKAADVVISKGQGNYEALSEEKDVFFLLLAKCKIVARDLKVPLGSIVIHHGRDDNAQ
jgi:uncharacterized protein with ATP-grasp and redox domains